MANQLQETVSHTVRTRRGDKEKESVLRGLLATCLSQHVSSYLLILHLTEPVAPRGHEDLKLIQSFSCKEWNPGFVSFLFFVCLFIRLAK